MVALSNEVRAALQAGHLAHLTTLNADGSPQVTVVWIGLEGDEIVCGHLPMHQKIRNMRRDPRVVISLVTGGVNPGGLAHYLVIAGQARVVDGGAAELLQRLARVYLGPGVKFPPMDDPPPGFVTRITIDRSGGVGPWGS